MYANKNQRAVHGSSISFSLILWVDPKLRKTSKNNKSIRCREATNTTRKYFRSSLYYCITSISCGYPGWSKKNAVLSLTYSLEFCCRYMKVSLAFFSLSIANGYCGAHTNNNVASICSSCRIAILTKIILSSMESILPDFTLVHKIPISHTYNVRIHSFWTNVFFFFFFVANVV